MTYDRNSYVPRALDGEIPNAPFVTRTPEGEYSTIRLADGAVETILFRGDGTTVGPVRTYVSILEIQRDHIRQIQGEIVQGA